MRKICEMSIVGGAILTKFEMLLPTKSKFIHLSGIKIIPCHFFYVRKNTSSFLDLIGGVLP